MRRLNFFAFGFCSACALALFVHGDHDAAWANVMFAAVNALFAFWETKEETR